MTVTQLRHLGLFDARVPRYTSYPTSPQFSPDVGPQAVQGWLAALPGGARISLYIHVPFCRRLCWFCACRTQGTTTAGPVAAYVETLKAELRLIAGVLPAGVTLGQLHWGGGTPTLMDAALIGDLSGAIADVVPLGEGAEFSVEIDPNEIDGARLDALMAAGMTRASIGVQDFDPDIQATIGRDQSFEVTKAAVDALRARGIRSLNVDLLYGLPHQTGARITSSVEKVLSLLPDRVALYGYAHVPWMARRQALIPTDALPSPEARLQLFETARKLFVWDGFDEVGIDHFARPTDSMAIAARDGTLRRNFQGYTVDPEPTLIGVGASAISRYRQGYAQNAPATSAYQGAIRDGRLATERGHVFAGEDLIRGRIIEELMCQFRADLPALAAECGADPASVVAMADGLTQAFPGMVWFNDGVLAIPEPGRPLTRMIARWFDAYAMAPSGHSPAV
jgi:oxygen-independent coproporphyrinogen III oxidase